MHPCCLCCQEPSGLQLQSAYPLVSPGTCRRLVSLPPFLPPALSCPMRRHQEHPGSVRETDLISPQKSIPLLSETWEPLTLLADVPYLGCLVNWNSSWHKQTACQNKNHLFAWWRGRPGATALCRWGKSTPLSHCGTRQHWKMHLGDNFCNVFRT